MDEEVKDRLVEVLCAFETLMVATNTPDGTIHARPMLVAEVEEGGDVWFATERESQKVNEVLANPTALVTGQGGGGFVSLSGELDIVQDLERIAALRKPSWTTWFSESTSDADVTLLRLRPSIGEYWLAGSLDGVRYHFEKLPQEGPLPRAKHIEHAKVTLERV